MIHWYIKYNRKFFILKSLVFVFTLIMLFILYYPKHILLGTYCLLLIPLFVYVDTITQIKRRFENVNAQKQLISKWLLKDAATYSGFIIFVVITGYFVIHFSPYHIPGLNALIGFLIAYILIAIGKWLRCLEDYLDRKRGNLQ
ncbi:hypothetical protein ETI08_04885 [Macrococcoides goetzii]|nr:hypothetical protein ETI08_04885 [Macrococcus goetzii]